MSEDEFVHRAVANNRGLTRAEARTVFRHYPRIRSQIIVYRTTNSAVTGGRSPASTPGDVNASAYPRRWCQITTRHAGRNLWFAVVASFHQRKRWDYDGWRVYPQRAIVWPDTTDNNWAWHFDRVNFSQTFYTQKDASRFAIHTTLRHSLWESISFPQTGELKAALNTKIAAYWHGGGKTYNRTIPQHCDGRW